MNTINLPFLSVIIPVFNNSKGLELCLAALDQQTYPKSLFKVIVIDNGSKDFDQLKEVVSGYSFVVLGCEDTPGSYAARNKGLSLAEGDIIAFTDSDCIPEDNWLEQGIKQLKSTENCGQVLGKVKLFFQNSSKPTLVEVYESLTALDQEKMLSQLRGGATANMFTWKHVIDKIGPFNSRLKSSGDIELGRRVYEAGYRQIFAPDVIVNHPARTTFQELKQRSIRISGGSYGLCIKPDDTFAQRFKMFCRLLLDDVSNSIRFTRAISQNVEIKKTSLKAQLIGLNFVVRSISMTEKVRLWLGGESTR
jgi:glycosyltransferase involved in cell wall biosynthesis